jgi:hypothetical protein
LFFAFAGDDGRQMLFPRQFNDHFGVDRASLDTRDDPTQVVARWCAIPR